MTPIANTPTASTADERVRLVVRMAVRAFSDGNQAADWLSQPNGLFDGYSPLFVATSTTGGLAYRGKSLERAPPLRERWLERWSVTIASLDRRPG